MSAKFLRYKTVTPVILSLLWCIACGPSESPRQEAHPRVHRESHQRQGSDAAPGNFDYYVLSLSWAPTFCESPEHQHARECDPSRNAAFVVHGLWPQRENGRSPEYCGNARQLDGTVINEALAFMPDRGLVRHEWNAHGTCSGLSPVEYFGAMKKARQTLRIPPPYRSPQRGLRTSASTVERRFAQASGIKPNGAVHVHCLGEQLAEVRVCFTKSLDPRTCGENVGECRANPIFMKPVR